MNTRSGFVLCAVLLFLMPAARAADGDLNITVDKKRLDRAPEGGMPHSDTQKTSEKWGYTVSVENQTFGPLQRLARRGKT